MEAYSDPFEEQPKQPAIIEIEVNDGAIYYAGPNVPVDYSAPAKVVQTQFLHWRKPQSPQLDK